MKVICLLALLVLSSSAASIEPTLPPVEEPGYWGDWSTVYSSCKEIMPYVEHK